MVCRCDEMFSIPRLYKYNHMPYDLCQWLWWITENGFGQHVKALYVQLKMKMCFNGFSMRRWIILLDEWMSGSLSPSPSGLQRSLNLIHKSFCSCFTIIQWSNDHPYELFRFKFRFYEILKTLNMNRNGFLHYWVVMFCGWLFMGWLQRFVFNLVSGETNICFV